MSETIPVIDIADYVAAGRERWPPPRARCMTH